MVDYSRKIGTRWSQILLFPRTVCILESDILSTILVWWHLTYKCRTRLIHTNACIKTVFQVYNIYYNINILKYILQYLLILLTKYQPKSICMITSISWLRISSSNPLVAASSCNRVRNVLNSLNTGPFAKRRK